MFYNALDLEDGIFVIEELSLANQDTHINDTIA